MANINNVRASIDANIQENGQQHITGPVMNYVLNQMVDLTEDNAVKIIQVSEQVKEKADRSGKYPSMQVGRADDLSGHGESVPAEFNFRATGGKSIKDGSATIKRIKGNSVVWNQWAKSFEEAYEKPNYDGITYNGNKVTIDNWRAYNAFRFDIKCSTAKDHLYLVLLNYANTNPDQRIYIEFGGENSVEHKIGNIAYFHRNIIYNNAYKDAFTLYLAETLEGTITLSDLQVIDLTKMFGVGNEPTTIEEYNARKPIVADEYAYNEGQVIHCNTESIKSVGDNAWNKDRARNINIDESNGEYFESSAWWTDEFRCIPSTQYYFHNIACWWYTAAIFFYDTNGEYIGCTGISNGENKYASGYATTPRNCAKMRVKCHPDYKESCMVTLVHSGWKQDTDAGYQPYWQDILSLPVIRKYFPDGMKSAGTAHDEIRFNKASGKWEAVQWIGSVDMSRFGWYEGDGFWASWDSIESMTDMKKPSDNGEVANICCKKYVAGSWTSVYEATEGNIAMYSGDGRIGISDSSIQSEADIIAATQGMILFYELAEPIVTELDAEDQDFQDYYQVADFGTEQMVAEQPSAAFSADIIYQFNAVDMIRENYNEIQKLKAMLTTLQAQLASK